MSYYDNQQWPAAGQPTWDQQTPPARSGASSAVPREDSTAFSTQLEEVDRAIDNLVKSGKMFGMPGRRDSMPMPGATRNFENQFDSRIGGAPSGPPRHHSVSDFGGDARSFSGSNVQGFYASQRHQPSRGTNEAEQVMQAKRRMAAQRERELRNYHQEQQYNRSVVPEMPGFGGKPDRTMSPGSGMSEEERRDLIARQRSALYGDGSFSENSGFDENGTPRPGTQGSGSQPAVGMRGHSPLAFDHFKGQTSQAEIPSQQATAESSGQTQGQGQQRSRANSTSSPSSNPTSSFSVFESAAQQSSRTSTSSPGGSPPRKAPTSSGVAPIGTRPAPSNPALNKRSTTPLPSPLSYGFAAANDSDGKQGNDKDGRTATPTAAAGNQDGLGWGSKSGGVWGKNSLGVQASVWG